MTVNDFSSVQQVVLYQSCLKHWNQTHKFQNLNVKIAMFEIFNDNSEITFNIIPPAKGPELINSGHIVL